MALFSKDQERAFEALAATSRKSKIRAFAVGGVVRDLLSGHSARDQDIDFLIEGNAMEFAELVARDVGGTVKRFEDFITAKIVAPEKFPSIRELDFASARTETYSVPGALPKVSLTTIQLDLKRRDFTVNAMALPIESLAKAAALSEEDAKEFLRVSVVDHFKGMEDLRTKRINTLHDASFIDDPTRIFRAARYAARIEGELSDATCKLVAQAVASQALSTISEQRKSNELKKIMAERRWLAALTLLYSWGVLDRVQVLSGADLPRLMSALGQLEVPEVQSPKVDRFAVLLALAGALSSPGCAALFSKIGVSHKRIAEFTLLRDWVTAVPGDAVIAKASDAALVAASLLSADESWKKLLQRRKLLGQV